MTQKEAYNQYESLKGCVNRIFVTNDYKELLSMTRFASIYLKYIAEYNEARIIGKRGEAQ